MNREDEEGVDHCGGRVILMHVTIKGESGDYARECDDHTGE